MSTATASGWWGIRWHFHFNFYLSFQNKKSKQDKKSIVKTFNKEKGINDILINKLLLTDVSKYYYYLITRELTSSSRMKSRPDPWFSQLSPLIS